MKNIKAILFDLDGTLRHNLPSGDKVFSQYAIQLGLPITTESETRALRWEHYYFASSDEIRADAQEHKERAAFWTNFSRRRLLALGLSEVQAEEFAPVASAYMAENYRPQPHVPEEVFRLLETLAAREYVLAVVSNRDERFEQELHDLKLAPYFKFSLAGGEVNAFKPDPIIFERALELAGSAAQETIYVGDNYFADVIGARRAGLWPVLLDPGRLFPEADCPLIRSFDEFSTLLED